VNCLDSDGDTPLLRALLFGFCIDVVMALFKMGANLLICNNDGRSVLHAAAWKGNVDCVDWLLANTAFDIDSTDNNGVTALMAALEGGRNTTRSTSLS
jgi:ankyrin repeat protein